MPKPIQPAMASRRTAVAARRARWRRSARTSSRASCEPSRRSTGPRWRGSSARTGRPGTTSSGPGASESLQRVRSASNARISPHPNHHEELREDNPPDRRRCTGHRQPGSSRNLPQWRYQLANLHPTRDAFGAVDLDEYAEQLERRALELRGQCRCGGEGRGQRIALWDFVGGRWCWRIRRLLQPAGVQQAEHVRDASTCPGRTAAGWSMPAG